ncbi:TRAP transporter small permease [Desulfosporosinus meridiei]|uniref:TRAP-type mannitol/chloroaromatic compound transport system, small permease component n=1 Tax=Desulfosporosinus meridiei (strain ATCC BAA-275 / DSM 13257 / KCTC 12902 / NCIMB 13706 / S10) TaxID=768704 RepID=J7IWR1_DESMD|nr:TRAP transporter small permease [Desulfosporosinus meridiei]AFQ43553.1 TRAP-type mannitol/chloroaromatic compound transport system, small permease component [Desulfosporosinus meridiei DSM 13257]
MKFTDLVKGVSSILDKFAPLCIFFVMLLIVANIFLRTVLNHPILGTYELVGFLTAVGVALALAHCAFKDGQIAVSLIMERFSNKCQAMVSFFVNLASLGLWAAVVWSLGELAQTMKIKGLVSPSAEIPVYPFIYLIAIGLLGLCLVLLNKSVISFRQILGNDSAKKVAR